MQPKRTFLVLGSILSLSVLLISGFLPSAFAATTVVNPTNMQGWHFFLTDSSGANSTLGTGDFVVGPSTPPFGIGSAQLATASGHGDGSAQIATANFDGTRLDSLTFLGYYTYDTVNNGQQFPYLQLSISTGLSKPSQDILFFEPPYQTPTSGSSSCPNQGPTVMNKWQSWDALSGCWWDNNGIGNPGTGVVPLSTILAAYPNAVIESYTETTNSLFMGWLYGASLTVGYASATDSFNGYVDGFIIGLGTSHVTYDFEPAESLTGVPQFGAPAVLIVSIAMVALTVFKRYSVSRNSARAIRIVP